MTLPNWWYEELRSLAARSRQVVFLAAVTGAVTGLAVALFDRVVVDGFLVWILDAPLWVQAILPTIGLTACAVLLRYPGRRSSPATADEYILAFHDPERRLTPRAFVVKVSASLATFAGGGALGLEGPAIFIGSGFGRFIHRRLPPSLRGETHTLLVAGAAAGVAAIFKAPATGAVFALEVPYQDDLARRSLLPALVAAAVGYLTFVSVNGTEPLIPIRGFVSGFTARDLGAALVLGVLCGGGARLFARMIRFVKSFESTAPIPLKIALGGGILGAAFVIVRVLTGESLTIGPGFNAISWSTEPGHAVWLLAAVLVLRCVATAATLGAGGAGGLFVPLVVAGALLGQVVGASIGESGNPLFLVVGVAAFLGAGYRVPLAAVMFVAEATGRASFVVPGLIAAVAAELLMGTASVSAYQRRPTLTGPD